MSFIWTIISPYQEFFLPFSTLGRIILGLGLFIYLTILVVLQIRWRRYNAPASTARRIFWIAFVVLVPLTSLFIGIRLPAGSSLPIPLLPVEPSAPVLMVFSAIPYALAAGTLGPFGSGIIAFISGSLLSIWDTRNLFTPIEMAILATILSAALKQRYRTPFYKLVRHALLATMLAASIYPILSLVSTALLIDDTAAVRIDYALSRVGLEFVAVAGAFVIAGAFAEVIARALQPHWGGKGELSPSPAEKSMQGRFLYNITPVALILVVVLIIGSWIVAEQTSRRMVRDRMTESGRLASEEIPIFLEAGQNLIKQIADDPRLYSPRQDQLGSALAESMRNVPYFTQLYYLDQAGNLLASYPASDYNPKTAPPEEQTNVQFALNNIPILYSAISPKEGGDAARVSYVAAVIDNEEQIHGIVIGRTDLNENPFSQPILTSLKSFADFDGEAILLDDAGKILYHPNPELLWKTLEIEQIGDLEDELFFNETAPDGTRRLVYYRPAKGRPWGVMLIVPARRAQQLALNIAAPLLGMIGIIALFSVWLLRFGLRKVTGSLQTLAIQTTNISQGELDNPVAITGVDEVGQLRQSFEQMRVSLKSRLDELNRLLAVSQGVASSLEASQAVRPILEAALSMGASSARVVLTADVLPDVEGDAGSPVAYGLGAASYLYAHLDDQILKITHQQDQLVLTSLTRPRLIQIGAGVPRPESLLAISLRHESNYYGSYWVGYDQARRFSDEEIRFHTTLASQAALAAANAHLFHSAEIGRQRLAAIVASTPDPIMVTDQENRLLLSNPAAWRVLGPGIEWENGQAIDKLIDQKELLSLLKSSSRETNSTEVALPNGKVYYATTSTVLAEGQKVGRVCIMRDVTYFKQLDGLKSEFVATVSHDLRSPLTLIRGYATMLEMVGELNDQQQGYVRKIVLGVEGMTHLVNNLLDLGRIEAGIGLQLEMVSVQALVERVVSSLQIQATQKRVQLTFEIDPDCVPMIEVDQALLQQGLHNLVENAIKYTERNGQVRVRVSSGQESLIFEVRDTGIGISPVDQPRLFEKFYRGARQGMKKQQGSGLGLAIVKSIAERHGGKVWVESQLGKGSTFYLSLPVRQAVSKG